jgi:hypothetical protein
MHPLRIKTRAELIAEGLLLPGFDPFHQSPPDAKGSP